MFESINVSSWFRLFGAVLCVAMGGCRQADLPPPEAVPAVALFGDRIQNASGEAVAVESLNETVVGLYFSALWCPPCRIFTPKLIEAYGAIREAGHAFEIILVSADRTEEQMTRYMTEYGMPWLAVPFGAEHRHSLPRLHRVSGIPALVIVDVNGDVLAYDGVESVEAHGAAAFRRWLRQRP